MRVLSLFSGVGGFDLGLERAGMTVAAQVEIDPYCRRVLERHWPGVARYEDVRGVSGETGRGSERPVADASGTGVRREPCELRLACGSVDLVCGGFPCQDLSVAGKRAGLDGSRSGLWFEFQRIVSELRPKYVLVENVPGLLSSNGGRDFEVVLRGLGDCGYAVSWAVLDSQHFGVAQRRRRVFVVAGPDPESTEAILAISEGCAGHPETRRAAGEDVANTLGGGSAESSQGYRNDLDNDTYIPEVSHPVAARDARGVNQREDAMTYIAVRTAQTSANGHGIAEDVAHTLDGVNGQAVAHALSAEGFDASEDGTGRGTPLVAMPLRSNRWGGSDSHGDEGNVVLSETLREHPRPGSNSLGNIALGASVRRLTPVECARLQGFPDDWLDGADGPQYRALGNAVTVSVIEYIGRRMMAVEAARSSSGGPR